MSQIRTQRPQRFLQRFFLLALSALLLTGLTGCAKKTNTVSGGSAFTLSGTLGGGLNGSAIMLLGQDLLNELSTLGEGLIHVRSVPVVNSVIALALFDGQVKSWAMQYASRSTVDSSGKMTLSIPKAQANATQVDYVVVLLDTTQTAKIDQVIGYLALSDATAGGLIKLPGSQVTSDSLDVGTVTQQAGSTDSKSSKSLSDMSDFFSVNLGILRQIAKTDGILKSVKNVYANYVDENQWVMSQPYFAFRGSMTHATNAFTDPATDVTYSGYGLYFTMLQPGVALSDLCGGSKTMTLLPPGTISTATDTHGSTVATDFSPASPLTSAGTAAATTTSSGAECFSSGDGGVYVHNWNNVGDGTLGYNWGGGNGFSGSMATGSWLLKLNGTQIGAFDFGAVKVIDSGDSKPTIYIPSVKFTYNGSNVLSQIDLKFYSYDHIGGSFVEITEPTAFLATTSDLSVSVDDFGNSNGRKTDIGVFTNNGDGSFTFKNFGFNWHKTDGTSWNAGTTSVPLAQSIAVGYTMYGASMRFDFRPYY